VIRYFFVLEGFPETHGDRFGTLLPDDNAAHAYAKRTVQELKGAGGYDSPDLRMVVKNSDGDVIHVIPF
jgi:hypothetical protein